MKKLLLRTLLVLCFAAAAPEVFAQRQHKGTPAGAEESADDNEVVRGSLDELRDMHRVLLVTNKSLTVDTRGAARAVLYELFHRPGGASRRHDYAHKFIGKKLNRYIRKHGGMTAVETLGEAEFIIVFKVLNEQRSFIEKEPHLYGEMFVIVNKSDARPRPVFVWWTKHNQTSVESAVRDFLKELKEARGGK